ncbi:kinase-like domain-containing protein [Dipodascopsis tothii]|uniref:kinase-like domain-containing protein n=1 Tax=Dipodascopsis tothii TaxID=44089 RepID=UPI0034CF8D84
MDEATQPSTQQQQLVRSDYESAGMETSENAVICRLICVTGQVQNVALRAGDLAHHESGRKEWVFGRNPASDVCLGNTRRVSNRHFKIWIKDSNTNIPLIEDLSTNGTFLNGARMPKHKSCILCQGDEIGVAFGIPDDEIKFMVQIPRTPSEAVVLEGVYAAYDIREELGKGAFARVKKGIERSTGNTYAIKIIAKRRIMTGLAIKREVNILMKLNHPSIVKLKELYEDATHIYLVMEYVAGGDLMDYITSHGPMPEEMASEVVKQVLEAVEYVHDLGISHRDIKPDNILLVAENPVRIKVSDFGLAKISESGTFLKTFCGTLAYLAPEVIKGKESRGSVYSNSVDMWSVGCLAYVLLTGYLPFNGSTHDQLCNQIMNGRYAQTPLNDLHISAEARSFLDFVLEVEPDRRPSATVALQHVWLTRMEPTQRLAFSGELASMQPPRAPLPGMESDSVSSLDGISRIMVDDDDDDMGANLSEHDSDELQTAAAELALSHPSSAPPPTSIVGAARSHLERDYGRSMCASQGVRNIDDLLPYVLPPDTWMLLVPLSDSIPFKPFTGTKDMMWFGRSEDSDMLIRDSRVSKTHCIISRKKRLAEARSSNVGLSASLPRENKFDVYLYDVSTNDCFVNGERMGNNRQARLQNGDEITLFRDKNGQKLAFRLQLLHPELYNSDRGQLDIRISDMNKNRAEMLKRQLHHDQENEPPSKKQSIFGRI